MMYLQSFTFMGGEKVVKFSTFGVLAATVFDKYKFEVVLLKFWSRTSTLVR